MTNRIAGAAIVVALLAGCGAASQRDNGGVMVSVRSITATAELRVYDVVNFTGSDQAIWAWSSNLVYEGAVKNFTGMPVGEYTFCAKDGDYGPVCVRPVKVLKNQVATVAIILQQAGNDGQVTIDSPFISGITLSDGAPAYGENITLSATVTGATPVTYQWSLDCANASSTFLPQAATTELTTTCEGDATVNLTVSNGTINSSVSFPLKYSPQGANVSVTTNDWPVLGGFTVEQAQLEPGASTSISITVNEPVTFTWSATCGDLASPAGALSNGDLTTTNTFTAPTTSGDCSVSVLAEDSQGGKATSSIVLHVKPSFVVSPGVSLSYCDGGPNANNYGPASPLDSATWSGNSLTLTKADACSGVGAEILVNPMPVITSLAFDVSDCIGTAPRFNVYYGSEVYGCGCSQAGTNTFTSCAFMFGAPQPLPSGRTPTGLEIVLDNTGTSTVSNIKVNGISVP